MGGVMTFNVSTSDLLRGMRGEVTCGWELPKEENINGLGESTYGKNWNTSTINQT